MSSEEQKPIGSGPAADQALEGNRSNESTSVEVPENADQQQPNSSSLPKPEHAYGILKRPMRFDPISVVFTILVLAAGIIGFVNKGSVMSVVSGSIFAALLAVGTYLEGARKNPLPLILTLFALASLMLWRYSKSPNYFPTALIAALACLLLARHSYMLYLRRRPASS